MSVREGFNRLAYLYSQRWWVLVIGLPGLYLTDVLRKPAPLDVDPFVWALFRSVGLTAVALFVLIAAWWLISGFIAPNPPEIPGRQPTDPDLR